MAAFPLDHLSQGWNSKHYKLSQEDPSITTEAEGGYMISRPRHTRTPRKSWVFGWDCTSDANKATLEAFWDARRGRSETFTWTDPMTGTGYTVRFKKEIDYTYMGMSKAVAGSNMIALKLWDIRVELEQV